MNVLITGASFENKGAQAMLYAVINEFRLHNPETDFYYLPIDCFQPGCFAHWQDFRFHFVFDDLVAYDYPAKYGPLNYVKRWNDIRVVKNRIAKNRYPVPLLSKIWDKLDVLVDVSGYSLTSKFGLGSVNRMLRHMEKARSMNIPVIIMPQSYGPFEFGKKTEAVCKRIHEVFSKAELVFAREEEGRKVMEEACGLTNLRLSPDTVLQAHDYQWENLFQNEPALSFRQMTTENNVGIVPNSETTKRGNKEQILRCYREIIGELRKSGKEVYIFRHSDDLALCREIYEMVKDDTQCHLIEDEMDCLSYSAFVQQLDFVVASRFHSIVNAYRVGVPALVLGWAIKYQELTKLVGQQKYVFDITAADGPDMNLVIRQTRAMIQNHAREAETIREKVKAVQQESCFQYCWELLG